MFYLKKILLGVFLPPLGPALLGLVGLAVMARRPRLGKALFAVTLILILILSMPISAGILISSLQKYPPISAAELSTCDAIVVLGGGIYADAPEYGGDTIGFVSLERLRYALYLRKLSGLPILATGGAPGGGIAEAVTMRNSAENDFAEKIQWIEDQSVDTASSARLSGTLLNRLNVRRVALVSHAWHLPRALANFETMGLSVVPAPMGFSWPELDGWSFLPNAEALAATSRALHEWLGLWAGKVGQIFPFE